MPRVVDHEQRRREIAYTVWEIIADQGIAAVTLRTIAARAEISMGRVQHYFPSRDAIVVHGLTTLVDTADDVFSHVDGVAARPPEGLRDLLLAALPRTPERRLAAKVWQAYLAEAVTDPQIAEVIGQALTAAEDHVSTLLGGDRDAARALLSLADGLTQRVLIGHLDVDTAATVLTREVHRLVGEPR